MIWYIGTTTRSMSTHSITSYHRQTTIWQSPTRTQPSIQILIVSHHRNTTRRASHWQTSWHNPWDMPRHTQWLTGCQWPSNLHHPRQSSSAQCSRRKSQIRSTHYRQTSPTTARPRYHPQYLWTGVLGAQTNHRKPSHCGMIVEEHKDYTENVVFCQFELGTPAHKTIRQWKSHIAGSIIRLIGDQDVYIPANVVHIMAEKRLQWKQYVTVQFAQPAWSATSSEGVPALQFDQLNVIARHMHTINTGETLWNDPVSWPPLNDKTLQFAILKGLALPKLSRHKVKTMDKWPEFLKLEWSQLNKY
jgi:hypothetical protein